MVHTVMPGTAEELAKGMATAYLGIDPTADSLHIGHLVGVMILKHFQNAGHRPIALVGGATGMIGDPSMKSQERKLLDEETLRHNQEAIKKQLSHFLDFDSDAPNAAILVNNYDWMKEFSFLDFIRDIGKCITVNYMMAKDSVKKRFNGEGDGMSFTEFTYQLVQGYDFLPLGAKREVENYGEPFRYQEYWVDWDNLEEDEEPPFGNPFTSGTLELIDIGDGQTFELVITGPCRGEVWHFCELGVQPCCQRQDFLGWFERWLTDGDNVDYFAEFPD